MLRRIVFISLILVLVAGGLLINLFLAGHALCGDCVPPLAMANHVAHFILLANLALFAIALIFARRWLILLWLLPGCIAFIIFFGQQWTPDLSSASSDSTIKIATFNVLGHLADPDQTFEAVMAFDADIVGLQELRPTLRGRLRQELRDRYPYQYTDVIDYVDGLGLLSSYPFLDQPYSSLPQARLDPATPRYLRAELDINGTHTAVYVLHTHIPQFDFPQTYNDDLLQQQMRRMAGILEAETYPTVLLCDCNSSPHSRQYALLAGQLNDAFRMAGFGFGLSFPAHRPLIRIDYVWYSDVFMAVDAAVLPQPATSDHLPLVVTLALRGG